MARNHYFDNVKTMLIVLVVFGHLIEPLAIIEDVKIPFFTGLYMFIYSFHMPVFAFVSGFFSKKLAVKPIFKLLYQLVIFQIIFGIFLGLLTILTPYQPSAVELDVTVFNVVKYLLTPIWILWYLLSLAFWRMMLYIFSFKKYLILISVVFAVCVFLIPLDSHLLSISRTISLFPFFLTGYHLTTEQVNYHLNKRKNSIYILAMSAFVGLLWFMLRGTYNVELFYFNSNNIEAHLSMGYAIYIRVLVYMISVSTGIVFMLLIPRRETFYTKFGKNTFNTYICHAFIFYLLLAFSFYNWLYTYNILAITLILFGMTLFIVWFFNIKSISNIISYIDYERLPWKK